MNIRLSTKGNTDFEKLLGHNESILYHWQNLENVFFNQTQLDKNLLEQIRRTLAYENECEYCMLKAGRPCFKESEKPIVLAVAFAQQFATNHKSITASDFEQLRTYFSEAEISEICSFISFISACQKFGKIMDLR